MTSHRVETLEGKWLDMAVAIVQGWTKWDAYPDCWLTGDPSSPTYQRFHPSIDWSQAGSIIEREQEGIQDDGDDQGAGGLWLVGTTWKCQLKRNGWVGEGPTPLVAAMRSFVSSKVGAEIELPERP